MRLETMEQNQKTIFLGVMSEEEFDKRFKKARQIKSLGKMTSEEFKDLKKTSNDPNEETKN